jgi:hypothetical protein
VELTLTVIAGVAGIAGGFWAGHALGKRVEEKPTWVYWLLNAAALVVGLVIDLYGLAIGSLAVATLGISLFAGVVSGLKYGYGRVIGPWKAAATLLDTTTAKLGPHTPGYREIPDDEPGFVTSPLGRDREDDKPPKRGRR